MSNLSEKIALIIRDIAELPDHNSPTCYPESFVITATDLEEVLSNRLTESFKSIKKAAQEIWYDNGMINRLEPLGEKLELLSKWLLKQDEIILMKIESELSALSDDDLETVCCGEESEQERLASNLVNEFLNQIFDEEYLVEQENEDE